MNAYKKCTVLILLLMSVMLMLGCSSQQPSVDEVKKYADPLTENILMAMNEDDYPKFSKNFDEKMKSALNEEQYKVTIPAMKAKVGNYLSKELVSVENKDGYTIVVYKTKFSQTSDDVIVKSVFSDKNGKKYVAGFWLDSPQLRDK